MTRNVGVILVSLLFQFSTCAIANDSPAVESIAAGGLVLTKTDHIQMVSEVLEISTNKISVTYHFLNTSDKDILSTVAFPMPAFNGAARLDNSNYNQRPLDSFSISVNGNEVPTKKQRTFIMNGIDVTNALRKIGMSDDQIFNLDFFCFPDGVGGGKAASCTISTKQVDAIEKIGVGFGGQIQETAYWEQIFPAGKDIEIYHEYTPLVGFDNQIDSYAKTRMCLDASTDRAILKKAKKLKMKNFYTLHSDVEYILGTGRNWKGPIKNFKLIIKRPLPDQIVSLCFPGKPKHTDPLTIEFSLTDYVPQDDLFISFIEVREMY